MHYRGNLHEDENNLLAIKMAVVYEHTHTQSKQKKTKATNNIKKFNI